MKPTCINCWEKAEETQKGWQCPVCGFEVGFLWSDWRMYYYQNRKTTGLAFIPWGTLIIRKELQL